jgi:hypothetical protein
MNDPILQAQANLRSKQLADQSATRIKTLGIKLGEELRKITGEDGPVFTLMFFQGDAVQYVGNATPDQAKQLMGSTIRRIYADQLAAEEAAEAAQSEEPKT